MNTLDLPPDQATAFPIESVGAALCREAVVRRSSAIVSSARGANAAARVAPFFGNFGDLRLVAPSTAGPGSSSSTARTPTTMRAGTPTPRCGWSRRGGIVMWHDYGVWEGVTRALEEIEARRNLGLRHIRGTSLVFWRAPAAPN